jgi:hypothetical protein
VFFLREYPYILFALLFRDAACASVRDFVIDGLCVDAWMRYLEVYGEDPRSAQPGPSRSPQRRDQSAHIYIYI